MGNWFRCIEPNEMAVFVSLLAIALSEGLDPDEKAAFGTFIAAVGDTVAFIGAQEILMPSDRNTGGCPSGGKDHV